MVQQAPLMLNADQLKQVIAESLSPHTETRRRAEENLQAAQKSPGFLLEILRLVASSDGIDPAVRQAAAVTFKNTVKKFWDPTDHDDTVDVNHDVVVISPEDRNTIKSHLVQLMCTTPGQIQAQLSESISLVAIADYPDQWQNLLPDLVQQFTSPNPDTVVGVLKTANSIFKRFRYVARSDALYFVILHTLHGIQVPLLTLFKTTGQAIDAHPTDPVQLRPRFEALRLMCRIFYSLNYQDLPEFFEEHMGEWMTDFAKYLQYENPVLTDPDEEVVPSPIDKLQAAIITNLFLYTSKDEEPFMEYLPNFTTLVWNLLMKVTPNPKHDILATTSIRFLSSLVEKHMHKPLFESPTILQQIVGHIVIPNLMFRPSDEERFEDDPHEYLVTEVEGSDSETRRKCSQDLLRAMCRQFESETTAICSGHITTMLQEYASDPNGKWKAKDAAIHLMMGITIRRESTLGVSELNGDVNLFEFFQAHVLPELQDVNHASRPVVKATSIKFVSTFRNQFTRENLVQLLPLLIHHLGSPIVVVHTFAAYAIERFLSAKGSDSLLTAPPKLGPGDIKPFLEPLFNGLFLIIDSEQQNENAYAMKCVMRSLASAGDDVIPVTQIVITKLTAALGRAAKNPRNPQYNHCLFESIAVLVRSVCSKDPNQTSAFEPLLFEPFTLILQSEIAEFTPYVFQVLAQLLEYRPAGIGLGPAYTSLFMPILTPVLWEDKGNVPPLTRLLQAYVRKSAGELVVHVDRILGVFQKLVSASSTEVQGLDLLSVALVHFPQDAMASKWGTIFQILLIRLQNCSKGNTKGARFKKHVTTFFALFIGKFGAQAFVDQMNALQQGLAAKILEQVWNPRLISDPPTQRAEAKVNAIGLTTLLCQNSFLLSTPEHHAVWLTSLSQLITMLTSPSITAAAPGTEADELEMEVSYGSQFSKLQYAKAPTEDFFPDVPDPAVFFARSLQQLVASSQPGSIAPLVKQVADSDPIISAGLDFMLKQADIERL